MSPLKLIRKNGEIAQPETDPECPLAVNGLTASYGEKPAVFSVDFKAPKGKMMAIIGPNGAGKSTLIKASMGIVPRLSGTVKIFGEPLEQQRHRVSYVPQRATVDWDYPARVIDVVMMGLYREIGFLGFPRKTHREKVMNCLERVGMADFAQRQIGELSGGQQQRVFLARSLAQNADLYLLDEPFSGVDAATERAIIELLQSLREQDKTIICVHHDLMTVRNYFDYILLINVRKFAFGPVETTFNADNLQSTYGGRLAATHIDELHMKAV